MDTEEKSHAYLFDLTENLSEETFEEVIGFSKNLFSFNERYKENNNKRIDKNIFPDLIIVEPEGNSIKKEQLIELQSKITLKPLEATKKIYIIKYIEKATPSAANSILKFLEEPNEDIIGILVTNNINKVIPTIISRCQVIRKWHKKTKKLLDFFPFANSEFKETIEAKTEFIFKILENRNHSKKEKISLYLECEQEFKGSDKEFYNLFLLLLKELLNIKYEIANNIFEKKQLSELGEKYAEVELLEKIKITIEFIDKSFYNINKKILLDNFFIEIIGDYNE